MIIEAEIGGHCIHRMYVNGESALEILGYDQRPKAYCETSLECAGGMFFASGGQSVSQADWQKPQSIRGCPGHQKLNGGFLAKSAEKSLPLFRTLKKYTKKIDFHWTAEAEKAFKQMKQLIAELPMLVAPMEKEELIIYLKSTKETIREYVKHYRHIVSVKGQILADFSIEGPEEDSPDTLMEMEEEPPEPWILFTDGSSYTDGSRARLILTNPKGMEFIYALRFRFGATNNEAEYEALIAGLMIAEQMGVKNL
uniref:Reverse transcriptase domain-containing protein n=1 Tax=Tanacetum cinerariifolium TaxID=118510 RepID=A0A699HHB4_TANCI|nr:reverse transcriptase domain-containing protein [Tanacetum cinerariifolium]